MRPPSRRQWRAAGLRYHEYRHFLETRFQVPVRRVSIDGGFTCPNVDGTVARGGCVFCNNRSFSPSRRLPRMPVRHQVDEGIRRLQRREPGCQHFIAYFQPATNTYAPVERLAALYAEALSHPQVVGLAVGTRPDCVPDPVLDLLTDLARDTYVAVELGVQTAHDRSLDWMNRGHHHAATRDALERIRGRGLELGAHLILGLPGETRQDVLYTAEQLAGSVGAVKLHNLYAVEDTPLAEQVRRGDVQLVERDEYVDTVVDVLERLPPRIVIQRISGDAPRRFLVAPLWCRDKAAVKRAVLAELVRRDSWQGKWFAPGSRRAETDCSDTLPELTG